MSIITPGQNAFENPSFQNLFTSVNLSTELISKGNLLSFNYMFWKHDPYPLVILTDYMPGNRVRGVNLNYLTFNYVKNILNMYGENKGFSYGSIKYDRYIVGAFRSYKWNGIRQVRKLDSKYLLNLVSTVRSFDKNNLEAIKETIQDQLNKPTNPKAETFVNNQQPQNPNEATNINQTDIGAQ